MTDTNTAILNSQFINTSNLDGATIESVQLSECICFDTSNNRIGINTANPECKIDISYSSDDPTPHLRVNDISLNLHTSVKNYLLDVSDSVNNIKNNFDGILTVNDIVCRDISSRDIVCRDISCHDICSNELICNFIGVSVETISHEIHVKGNIFVDDGSYVNDTVELNYEVNSSRIGKVFAKDFICISNSEIKFNLTDLYEMVLDLSNRYSYHKHESSTAGPNNNI
jgi:hypothetical protein